MIDRQQIARWIDWANDIEIHHRKIFYIELYKLNEIIYKYSEVSYQNK